MPHSFPSRLRRGRINKTILASLVPVLLVGAAVWWMTRDSSPSSRSLKDMSPGKLISVAPLPGYEPALTDDERELLRAGPSSDPQKMKLYLLAKAKLEPDGLTRTFLQQEAVINADGYGLSPAIENKSPQARSVIEAVKAPTKFPERLTPGIAPKPFDAAAYKENPTAYLAVAEPGRVFQTKPLAATVPAIEAVSPYFQDVKVGGEIELAVKAAPGYPVTFTSMDSGRFKESGLVTVTVQADSAGMARVHFEGVPGTVLESNILAASPMSSGSVRFKANTLVYADGKSLVSR